MPEYKRLFLSSHEGNINKQNNIVNYNHPIWLLPGLSLKAKKFKVTKINFPITFPAIDPSRGNVIVDIDTIGIINPIIEPIGFQTVENVNDYLGPLISANLIDFSPLLQRFFIFFPFSTVMTINNPDFARVLGFPNNSICTFNENTGTGFGLSSVTLSDGTVLNLGPISAIYSCYMTPYVGQWTGITNINIKSSALGSLTGGYMTHKHNVDGDQIGTLFIDQPYGTVQRSVFYDASDMNLLAQRSGFNKIDVYFTRYIDGNEVEIDFGGIPFAIEFEFQVCLCDPYEPSSCDGV